MSATLSAPMLRNLPYEGPNAAGPVVRVFRNLTRRCLSIQAKGPKGWRTVAYARSVELDAVRFHVGEAGRARVLATGRKNVHAWAEGTLAAWDFNVSPFREGAPQSVRWALGALPSMSARAFGPSAAITYNPRKAPTFVRLYGGQPVRSARGASIGPFGILASDPA